MSNQGSVLALISYLSSSCALGGRNSRWESSEKFEAKSIQIHAIVDLIGEKSVQIDKFVSMAWVDRPGSNLSAVSETADPAAWPGQDLVGTKGGFNEVDGSGWRRCRNRKRIGCLVSRTCRRKQFLFVTRALDIEVWIPGVNSDILKSESRNDTKCETGALYKHCLWLA